MNWVTCTKAIETTLLVGHRHTDPGVIGRAPAQPSISFGPLELYGAAARCSHLNVINPAISTIESELIAKLLGPHVDDSSPNFAIQKSANHFKDFMKSYFAGTVAQGIAYLSMIEEGYVWSDHFENLGGCNPDLTKHPDFVFAGHSTGVALMEAKGSRSGSRNSFDTRVRNGYTDQIEGHLGHYIGSSQATHGYCIGAWMKSQTKAELRVHHTAIPSSDSLDDIEDGTDDDGVRQIMRHNYATAFGLAHGLQLAQDIRRADSRYDLIEFLRVEWLGRTWLTGMSPGYTLWPFADDWRDHSRWRGLVSREPIKTPLFFAVEERIAKSALASFLNGFRSRLTGPDGPVFALDDDFLEQARGLRRDNPSGAAFPDGLAILDLSKVSRPIEPVLWDVGRQRLL